MLFILLFVSFAVALPAIGEVWRHPNENVFTRSREELVVVTRHARERLEAQREKSRLACTWTMLLLSVFAIVGFFLNLFADFRHQLKHELHK